VPSQQSLSDDQRATAATEAARQVLATLDTRYDTTLDR